MVHHNTLKDQLGHFGRVLSLLLNRSMMYQKDHPLIKESIDNVYKIAGMILYRLSTLVFILNRGHFYVDEEALDPRINVARIADLFKNVGIQSISFEKGLSTTELANFLVLFSKLTKASEIEEFKKSLFKKGIFNIKVNHVVYKKVTEDDQVVSREALKKVTPMMETDDPASRKKFLDALLESVLSEELSKTLNIGTLMENPSALTQNMIDADLAGARHLADQAGKEGQPGGFAGEGAPPGAGAGAGSGPGIGSGEAAGMGSGSGPGIVSGGTDDAVATGAGPERHASQPSAAPGAGGGAGTLLVHQLDLMQREVARHIQGQGDVDLSDLAFAIFDMKKQLLESIQTQKALGVAYANEAAIIDNADQLTDNVIIELIKDEYASGKITTPRLAMIMRRLIPDARELKRLMPKIKVALLASGMSIDDFMGLINELQNELQSEELTRILQESSESIGMDGNELIAEFKRNPTQAAELIYLASEIRAGAGDAEALTSILVEYVEQLSGQMVQDEAGAEKGAGEDHLKNVVAEIESGLLHQLSRMNVDAEVLARMETRINERMESILDKMRVDWLQHKSASDKKEPIKPLTVFQTLENNVGDDEEMGQIIKAVRKKIDSGDIEENDFGQIYAEIDLQKKRLKDSSAGKQLNADILQSEELIFILEKEVAKAKRYPASFSALAFSLVTAKPKIKTAKGVLTQEAVADAALDELAEVFRDADFLGQIGKNKMVAILPMTSAAGAKMALSRVLKALHAEPLMVRNIPVEVRVAGIAETYNQDITPDARSFARHLSNQLMDMVARVKSIQVLF
jgi:hypothetical protein